LNTYCMLCLVSFGKFVSQRGVKFARAMGFNVKKN